MAMALPAGALARGHHTSMIPLRRRMPDIFDHGSNLKMVGMAGFPPVPTCRIGVNLRLVPQAAWFL